MSKISAVLLLIGLSWCSTAQACIDKDISEAIAQQTVQALEPDPQYAKWSRLAFHEAGKVYTLLDYRYLGHSHVAAGVDQQQFRFWVRHKDVEFPLIVSIRYDPVSEKLFTIDMEQERRRNLQIL
ncbi:DUF3889 domain-containing protein [Paenibacillus aceris]|uniref:DUF3889 domain-containing protein n=1 Tax=Paenibacillus aceris TaxID=869555 RepID=A0ABS4I504_9BACL|nr:DUF3889 domain-containing protein [Paenibacillus aceris]MBP1965997.1 hypothetical protein [Paenibacillus aceris]NHW39775.1 DUF3889 domain-containing protein [Paenibacillus aceris]